jgi:tetratricopeptide (TPR) repeat protein
MKRLFLLFLCFSTLLFSQSTAPSRQADFERRFKEAVAAVQKQDYSKARQICDGIIKEEPKARGSLLIAGMASLELFEPSKAAAYLEAFRKLEPQDPQGIILSIQANQADKKVAKVESLLKELLELRKTNKKLQSEPFFLRERYKSEKNRVVLVREYYDFRAPPYKVWDVNEAELTTSESTRALDFSYNVGVSEGIKKGDAFFLGELVFKNGQPQQINIYREEKILPDYSVFRKWIVDAIQQPPKPIYSAPYQAAASQN